MRNGNWRQILQLPHVSGGTTLRHVPLCPPEAPRDIGPGAHSGELHTRAISVGFLHLPVSPPHSPA